MKKTAIVFSHAHWDVEWYMPYRSFRFWLTDLIDGLLDICEKEPRFHTFVLDGQVAPVEHYISVNPDKEKQIRRLIKEGKLTIGPFYTQYDEWLISGEAIVRNTLHGILKGREFGEIMKAGYLPDNFGHPLQMPQIMQGFDLDSLIFMRGMPDMPEGMGDEFYVKGLDGTCVLGIHLKNGYGNAFDVWNSKVDRMTIRTAPYNEMFSGYESEKERITDLDVEATAQEMIQSALKAAKSHPSGILPLAAGCDHCPPIAQIPEIIEYANQLQDEIHFIQGDCQDIVEAIKNSGKEFPTFDKELWGSRYQHLLTGTLSTRTYIKQANFAAESLITQYSEPIASIASLFGKKYPTTLLEEAWGYMYLNQAHDSIHGSSVDPVHREMMQRYDNVKQISVGIIHDTLKYLGTISDCWYKKYRYGILTYNPVSTGSDKTFTDVWVRTGDQPFHLEDRNGNMVLMQILDNTFAAKGTSGKEKSWIPAWPDAEAQRILFQVQGEANSIESLAVVEGEQKFTCYNNSDAMIENEYIQVEFADGALNLYDKVNGKVYKGLGIIEDEADDGDAWDFSEPWKAAKVYSSNQVLSKCHLIEKGPVRSTLLIESRMKVPHHMENGKRSRQKVELPLNMRVSLYQGAKRVEIVLELDNQAKDHRLRLKCSTGINCEKVKSQGHFGIIERPLKNTYEGKDWIQPPANTFHFKDWIAINDGTSGFAIACRGLNEYQAINQNSKETTLYITLLRGIERMTKVGLKSRKGEASDALPMPEAQCLGLQRFEFAFLPFSVGEDGDDVRFTSSANAFLYPPVAHLIREKQSIVVKDIENPIFQLTPSNLVVSAFKMAEIGNGYILRFWENEGKSTKGKLLLNDPSFKVFSTDLKEENMKEVEIKDGIVNLEVGAYKIVTLKLVKE